MKSSVKHCTVPRGSAGPGALRITSAARRAGGCPAWSAGHGDETLPARFKFLAPSNLTGTKRQLASHCYQNYCFPYSLVVSVTKELKLKVNAWSHQSRANRSSSEAAHTEAAPSFLLAPESCRRRQEGEPFCHSSALSGRAMPLLWILILKQNRRVLRGPHLLT